MVALNIFHVLIAVAMVALVLVQRGSGATAGAAFGSGASGTVFGSRGAGNFLTKSTWVLATLFCSISLFMAVMVSRGVQEVDSNLGVIGSAPEQISVPVTDQGAAGNDAAESQGVDLGVEQQNDLPSLQTEEAVDGAALQESAADDLPLLDDTSTEAVESTLDEVDSGTTSDGS
jgi:preprotein translocase subunit SecG